MKICILGAAFDTANMGVSVLAAGALQCALHRFPDADLIQMDYGREGYAFGFSYNGELREVRFVNIRFSKKLYLRNHIVRLILTALMAKAMPFKKVRAAILGSNSWLREVVEADLVLSLAGGDSFSDIYGLRRFVYISLPQILVILTKRRLILLPQTIGPFRSRIAQAVAKYILKRAQIVYCRDSKSAELSKVMIGARGEDNKVRMCYDLGFDVAPMKSPTGGITGASGFANAPGPLVGINVSGLLMTGGYNQANMFELRTRYPELIRSLIDSFLMRHSARVLLVPHTIGSFTESDLTACEGLFEELRDKYYDRLGIVRSNAYAETKCAIGRCEFFVGARMHACIGALSQGVPAVSLAYSDKFSGVMETIGCASLVVDLRKESERSTMSLIDSAFASRQLLKRDLDERMPQVRQAIRNVLGECN